MLTAVAAIFTISSVSCVDLPILLFFEGPLPRNSRSRARALEDSVHTSMIMSRLATVLGFFMVISSTVLRLLTPSWKALMILMSWMYGLAFLALQKYFT
jgi:hypothetical protein